mmetsp:Transcript_51091/g.145909  ORF Transcript_51091/g.145909 Transcript_51091/m.145909 type:complete len:266 (-) Transcript_51091:996-1793(-)
MASERRAQKRSPYVFPAYSGQSFTSQTSSATSSLPSASALCVTSASITSRMPGVWKLRANRAPSTCGAKSRPEAKRGSRCADSGSPRWPPRLRRDHSPGPPSAGAAAACDSWCRGSGCGAFFRSFCSRGRSRKLRVRLNSKIMSQVGGAIWLTMRYRVTTSESRRAVAASAVTLLSLWPRQTTMLDLSIPATSRSRLSLMLPTSTASSSSAFMFRASCTPSGGISGHSTIAGIRNGRKGALRSEMKPTSCFHEPEPSSTRQNLRE